MAHRRTALVTGGGSGIGAAIAKALAKDGCNVVVSDISLRQAEGVCQELAGAGVSGEAFAVEADVASDEANRLAIEKAAKAFGGVDILVNNAGWDRIVNFIDTDTELWDKVIAINLRGPIGLTHLVVPGMVERQFGRIINIASDAGRVGSSGEAVYSACKGGMIAFAKTLARELARSGVTANAVCPGPTDTPLLHAQLGEGEAGQKIYEGLKRAIPMKRLGHPNDLAGLVAFLAGDAASFITGQTVSVSGGLTMHG
ncbi:MAG: glucose 1-dehydrogenase [Pseudomonadota bacterium]